MTASLPIERIGSSQLHMLKSFLRASFHRKVEVARARFLKDQEQHFRFDFEVFAYMTGAEIDFKSITIAEIALVVNANTL